MGFEIIRNDITKVTADAIVNTANPHPVIGGGTDCAVYEAAGADELLAARREIGEIARGDAKATPAFALNAKYIIHTVGPVWEDGEHGEPDVLRACYENSLKLAEELGCRSAAFPLISTGVYGFPKDRALKIAMSVIQSYVMDHSMDVTLVVFDHEAFRLCGAVFDHIRAYISTADVLKMRQQEYAARPRRGELSARDRARLLKETESLGNLSERYRNRRAPEPELEEDAEEEPILASAEMPLMAPAPQASASMAPMAAKKAAPKKSPLNKAAKKAVNIDDLIAAPDKTFQEKLFEIIDERGLTGPEVYKDYISRQVYSKIQADRDYHPNKYTAIALCLSLHLDLEETQDLIGRAGWALSTSKRTDLIVRACILNQEYNIVNINILLYEYHCPLLDKIK